MHQIQLLTHSWYWPLKLLLKIQPVFPLDFLIIHAKWKKLLIIQLIPRCGKVFIGFLLHMLASWLDIIGQMIILGFRVPFHTQRYSRA